MVDATFNYTRKVTHTQYKHGDKETKKGGFSRMLPMRITDDKQIVRKSDVGTKGGYPFATDVFLKCPINPKIMPLWLGSLFLFLFLFFIYLYLTPSDKDNGDYILFYLITFLSFLGFLFFATYYFTMPTKELIFNRADGLVTFPGFMWHKNITMPIHKMMFSMSSPSTQGGGAYMLQIVRPDRTYSLYLCSYGLSCYEDLSFFLWYMDKNRPLPTGEGFDPCRLQDYERRKSEGFPKPLFPCSFETPEATLEQQAERERIGGW